MSAPKELTEEQKLKLKQKEERRLLFEARRAEELKNKENDSQPSNKTKGDLKRERREKQEAQRAAKEQVKKEGSSQKDNENVKSAPKSDVKSDESVSTTSDKEKSTEDRKTGKKNNSRDSKAISDSQTKKDTNKDDLFSLYTTCGYNKLHISLVNVGIQINKNSLVDVTSQCMAVLSAFQCMVKDLDCPSNRKPLDYLQEQVSDAKTFLDACKPMNISLLNVIRIVSNFLSTLPEDISLEKVKDDTLQMINRFIYEEIECDLEGIKEHGNKTICDGETIMVYNFSVLVKWILSKALKDGKYFKVIVVEGTEDRKGQKMVEFLNQFNVHVTYVFFSAVAHVIDRVDKVLLEAHSLLANGYMMADNGTSQLALIASTKDVPVLACCETYKFSEQEHTEALKFNNREPLFSNNDNSKCQIINTKSSYNRSVEKTKEPSLIRLCYDLTPPGRINMVITELGFILPTSVPAIIQRNANRGNISQIQLDYLSKITSTGCTHVLN